MPDVLGLVSSALWPVDMGRVPMYGHPLASIHFLSATRKAGN